MRVAIGQVNSVVGDLSGNAAKVREFKEKAAQAGADLAQAVAAARHVADAGWMIQTADTLKYLYMGGRIGRAKHLVGSLLNVKPIIGMEEGIIAPMGQARSRDKAYGKILELMRERNSADHPIKVAVTHVAAPERAEVLLGMVKQSFDCHEALISELSPALGVHTGPGLVGVNFFPVLTDK